MMQFTKFRAHLIAVGIQTQEDLDRMDAALMEEVGSAFNAALEDPVPDAALLAADDVYAEARP